MIFYTGYLITGMLLSSFITIVNIQDGPEEDQSGWFMYLFISFIVCTLFWPIVLLKAIEV